MPRATHPPVPTTMFPGPQGPTTWEEAQWLLVHGQIPFSNKTIPGKALSQILGDLDEESLFDLGRTWYESISTSSADSTRFLHAVRSTISVGRLTEFSIGLYSHDYLRGLLDQLCDLLAIVQLQPENHSTALRFSAIDNKILTENGRCFAHGYRLTSLQWNALLLTLLSVIVNKGCKHLHVDGGTSLFTSGVFHRESPPATGEDVTLQPGPRELPNGAIVARQPDTRDDAPQLGRGPMEEGSSSMTIAEPGIHPAPNLRQNRKRKITSMRSLISNIGSYLKPSKFSEAPPLEREAPPVAGSSSATLTSSTIFNSPMDHYIKAKKLKSSLQTLRIVSDMLLLPDAIDWTTSLLRTSSFTLAELDIACSITSSTTWNTFLYSVQLPHLRRLIIATNTLLVDVNQMLDVNPDDLAAFLSRNRSLEVVKLYGVKPGVPSPTSLERFRMPRLTSFTGHPTMVSWVFQGFCGSFHSFHTPRLERVVMSTEYYVDNYAAVPFPHHFLDNVLRKLGSSRHDRGTLGIQFETQSGMDDWIYDHINPKSEGYRLIRSLVSLQTLALQFQPTFMSFKGHRLEAIAKLVDAFPAVEHLVVDGLAIDSKSVGWDLEDIEKTEDFFGRCCPRLKTMEIKRYLRNRDSLITFERQKMVSPLLTAPDPAIPRHSLPRDTNPGRD